MTTTTAYALRIYDRTATKIVRESQHATRTKALKSRDDYERRHGKAPHAIDAVKGVVSR